MNAIGARMAAAQTAAAHRKVAADYRARAAAATAIGDATAAYYYGELATVRAQMAADAATKGN